MPLLAPPALTSGVFGARLQPSLATDELVIRPWRPTDAVALASVYDDADIQRWHVRSMTQDEARTWIGAAAAQWSTDIRAEWAITQDDELVGRVGVCRLNLRDGAAEMAYWTVPTARGREIASRALRRVSEWLLSEVGIHRLSVEHSTQNAASCRVAIKAGYQPEAVLHSSGLHADGWHDMHVHALIAPDELSPSR